MSSEQTIVLIAVGILAYPPVFMYGVRLIVLRFVSGGEAGGFRVYVVGILTLVGTAFLLHWIPRMRELWALCGNPA